MMGSESIKIEDFEVRVRIYNNQLRQRRQELGMSQVQLAKSAGISQASVNALETMRVSPRKTDGSWRDTSKAISVFLGVGLDELFPPMTEDFPGKSEQAVTVSSDHIMALLTTHQRQLLGEPTTPEEEYEKTEAKNGLYSAISTLSEREAAVIRHRFGIETKEKTTRQVSDDLGVTPERIRQIEAKALKKLRHPSATNLIRDDDTVWDDPIGCDSPQKDRHIVTDRHATSTIRDSGPRGTVYYILTNRALRKAQDLRYSGTFRLGARRFLETNVDGANIQVFYSEWSLNNAVRLNGYSIQTSHSLPRDI